MTSHDPTTVYYSYIIRVWREPSESGSVIRYLVIDPHSGARRGFHSTQLLTDYLHEVIGSPNHPTHSKIEPR